MLCWGPLLKFAYPISLLSDLYNYCVIYELVFFPEFAKLYFNSNNHKQRNPDNDPSGKFLSRNLKNLNVNKQNLIFVR